MSVSAFFLRAALERSDCSSSAMRVAISSRLWLLINAGKFRRGVDQATNHNFSPRE